EEVFVKSFEVPEGVTLTVKGKFTTESTFENGFVIAQLFINGGKVDFAEGTPDEFCNICFNSGELIAPKDGFADTVSISRYIYENVTIDSVKEAFETENLRTVVVQEGLEIAEPFTVPEGKTLSISSTGEPTFITVKNGAGIDGNVSADPGCGVILLGDAHLNDITVTAGAEGSVITWQEDGSFTVEACDAEGNVR
ncbi:MAG: hypothetical protein HUJ76_12460, partial [Parasporobacterium sp.]|nr:hypothetical protein [Parasporobacterium sp.]